MSGLKKIPEKIPEEIKYNIPFYLNAKTIFQTSKQNVKYNRIKNDFFNDRRFEIYDEEIKSYYNIHKGERCFVLGSGPSLNKTDLRIIKDEILIGANALYKGYPKFKINCQYYTISDPHVWHQNYKNILSLDTKLFIGTFAAKDYLSKKNVYHKYQKNDPILVKHKGSLRLSKWKNKNLSDGAYGGHQIIAAMSLQMAYYMGFKEVYLLGCDCDYSKDHHFNGEKRKTDPQSKYSKGYWDEVFEEYEIIKKGFEEDGRKIYNSTIDGKLEVFERKKLEDIS